MEQLDQTDRQHGITMDSYAAQLDASTTSHFEPKLLDGVMVLSHPGTISVPAEETGLYYSAAETRKAQVVPTTLKLIPYYAWANRTPAAMQVWIPYSHV
jgi:DUF1680 family protein